MHEQLEQRPKKKSSIRENIGLIVGGCITLIAAVIMDGRGFPQKWHAAIFGTVLPFEFVVFSYPLRWLKRPSFWASVAICLVIHILGIWIFFQYVLISVRAFGFLLWFPVAAVEAIVLLLVVKKIEEKLTGKHEIVELWER